MEVGDNSSSHSSPFQHWLGHGLTYVLASLPMRSGHVTAMAVDSILLKGMVFHKQPPTSLVPPSFLSVLALKVSQ
jgi:hypothetical protein